MDGLWRSMGNFPAVIGCQRCRPHSELSANTALAEKAAPAKFLPFCEVSRVRSIARLSLPSIPKIGQMFTSNAAASLGI